MIGLLGGLGLAVWTVYVAVTGGLVALVPTACVAALYGAWRLWEHATRPDPWVDGPAAWQRRNAALARRRGGHG